MHSVCTACAAARLLPTAFVSSIVTLTTTTVHVLRGPCCATAAQQATPTCSARQPTIQDTKRWTSEALHEPALNMLKPVQTYTTQCKIVWAHHWAACEALVFQSFLNASPVQSRHIQLHKTCTSTPAPLGVKHPLCVSVHNAALLSIRG